MATEAKIEISAEGAEAVRRAFEAIAQASKDLAGEIGKTGDAADKSGKKAGDAGKSWRSFAKDVGSSIATTGKAILATVTALNTISFAEAIKNAKELDASLVKASAGGGGSVGALRDKVRGLSQATLQQEKDVLAWSKSVGRVTYDYKGALDSVKAFSAEALASNQDLSEQAPLAEVLGNTLNIKGDDTAAMLGKIRGMAESLGTVGGVNAFKDQIVALNDAMNDLSLQTPEAKEELLAFEAALGKGLNAKQAARVQGKITSFFTSHAEGLRREYGMEVLDEQGHLKDLPTLVKTYRDKMVQRYGSTKEARRVAQLNQNLGPEAGAAFMSFNVEDYRKALNAPTSPKATEAVAAVQASPEGQRMANDLKRQQTMEDAGREALPANDWLGDFTAKHPLLASVMGFGGAAVGGAAAKATGGAAMALAGGKAVGLASVGGMGLIGAAGLGGLAVGGGAGYLLNKYAGDQIEAGARHAVGMPSAEDQLSAMDASIAEAKQARDKARAERAAGGGADLSKILEMLPQTLADAITKAQLEAKVTIVAGAGVPADGIQAVQSNSTRQ